MASDLPERIRIAEVTPNELLPILPGLGDDIVIGGVDPAPDFDLIQGVERVRRDDECTLLAGHRVE